MESVLSREGGLGSFQGQPEKRMVPEPLYSR